MCLVFGSERWVLNLVVVVNVVCVVVCEQSCGVC